VIAKYGNFTFYRIDGIDRKTKLTDKIQGTELTYLEYYKTKYNIKIKEHNQPLLIHKNRRRNQEIHLIPELCYMTGLEDH